MATVAQSLRLELAHGRALILKLTHAPTQPAASERTATGATFIGRLIVDHEVIVVIHWERGS